MESSLHTPQVTGDRANVIFKVDSYPIKILAFLIKKFDCHLLSQYEFVIMESTKAIQGFTVTMNVTKESTR